MEALRQEKVGTIKGSSMAEAVRAVVPASNVDDSFPPGGLPAALVAGKVSAVVLGIESAIAAQRQDAEVELGAFVGPPRSLAYGVRKTDAALRQALNEYIDNVRRTTDLEPPRRRVLRGRRPGDPPQGARELSRLAQRRVRPLAAPEGELRALLGEGQALEEVAHVLPEAVAAHGRGQRAPPPASRARTARASAAR